MYDLKKIIGNSQLIKSLAAQIKNRAVTHAYIFGGEKGLGKKLLAYSFAKAILCEEGSVQASSCNVCTACRTLESGNNPDIITIKMEKTKSIGVDDMRDKIVGTVFIRPLLYDRKIYVIENAEFMTTSAQIAFLKTLEESPPYCSFLLTADNPGQLLPTVLSRCVSYILQPLSGEDTAKHLTDSLGMDIGKAAFLAGLSGGNIGRAENFASSESFIRLRSFVVETLDGIYGRDIADLFDNAKSMAEYKDDIPLVLDMTLLWYRDALTVARLGSPERLIQKDVTSAITEAAKQPLEHLIKCAGIVEDIRNKLRHNANFQLAVDVMLLKLSGL